MPGGWQRGVQSVEQQDFAQSAEQNHLGRAVSCAIAAGWIAG